MSPAAGAYAFDADVLYDDLLDDGLDPEWAGYVTDLYVEADGPMADEITGNALTGSTEAVLIDTMAADNVGPEFAATLIAALRGVLVKQQPNDDNDQEDQA